MKKFIFIILGVVLWFGCYDEDALVPSETPEYNYVLPQGDHDYDAKIVDWYERCGFYILYKFEPRDVYWELTNWTEAVWDSLYNNFPSYTFKATPGDERYVGMLLNMVESNFLEFYPDTLLKRCMPLKLLLCGSLDRANNTELRSIDVWDGFDFIAVNHANEAIATFTESEVENFRKELNVLFLHKLTDKGKLEMSKAFAEISSYDSDFIMEDQMYALGFLSYSYGKKSPIEDWAEYIEVIASTPYEVLTAEPGDGDYSFKGILHAKKDVNGLIRRKYDVVVNYFKKEYQIDIQAIGGK